MIVNNVRAWSGARFYTLTTSYVLKSVWQPFLPSVPATERRCSACSYLALPHNGQYAMCMWASGVYFQRRKEYTMAKQIKLRHFLVISTFLAALIAPLSALAKPGIDHGRGPHDHTQFYVPQPNRAAGQQIVDLIRSGNR